jgi:hypothetical protein
MKIDSEYLDIDIMPEFMCQTGTIPTENIEFELWYEGDIQIYADAPMLNYKIYEELVRVYKLFKDRRTFYLASIRDEKHVKS